MDFGARTPSIPTLFLDGEALVIDKPAGLAVTPPRRGGASLADLAPSLRFGFQRLPEPVHRLDRDTSGCLLLARNPKALRRFQRAFEERRVGKRYLAVVDGIPDADEGTIALALAKVSTRAAGWRIVPDPTGKPAVTHWRRLTVRDGRSLIAFTPETGRTHQIRVHAAAGLGTPVTGDPVYGRGDGVWSGGPMLLHSHWLRIARDGKPPVEASAPLPAAFGALGFGDADVPFG